MMPLSEIYALSAIFGAVGDRFAASWGVQPGRCRFVRSSDNHVFALPGGRFLRAVPDRHRARGRVEALAALMDRLRHAGCAVVTHVPSLRGSPVESVLGYNVTVVDAAPGRIIGAEELSEARAAAWGAALARLHAHGVTHGDFELDNLAWAGDTPTAFDFDGAGLLDERDDIAYATRELPPGTARAWLAGYRSIRPLPRGETFELSSGFWRRRASLLGTVLDLPEAGDDPDWLRVLRRKVEAAHAEAARASTAAV